jgi:dihydroorotate dehydrogenase electron transfer subunit
MTHYADTAVSTRVQIVDNYIIARDTMCLRVAVPMAMCASLPGQFFMLRDVRGTDPLIGRAFALYDCNTQEGWIEIVYLVKGKLTTSIATLRAGDEVGLVGPLGNSFDDSSTDHLIIVVGGIGQTPMVCLTREATGKQQFGSRNCGYAKRVSLCYGVRTREYLAGVDSFENAGAQVHIATEDGSIGPPQRVTAVLLQLLDKEADLSQVRIVCCGPEPMMEAVSQIAIDRNVHCQVSLETPMACGIGICFTCVAKVGCESDWDYKRTCVEGPVFEASDVVWK